VVLDEHTQQWQAVRDVDSLALPDSLRGLLLSKIDGLATDERRVLQLAAVIGLVFWSGVLDELVGENGSLERCLVNLERSQFIVRRGRVPRLGVEYAFRSSLVRELARDSLLAAQREELSLQVADYLAQLFGEEVLAQYYGVVAYQYRCAKQYDRELFYTLSAAEYAQSVYANAEALEYYERALELLDTLEAEQGERRGMWQEWRLESLKGLGKVCFGMGRVREAEPYLRRAISVAEQLSASTDQVIHLYYWLCEVLFWEERYEEQIAIAKSGLELLQDKPRSRETALMNQEIAVGYRASGDLEQFIAFTRQTAQFLDHLPYSEELRPAYDHVVSMYAFDLKDVDRAMPWLDTFGRNAEAHHDVRAMGQVDDYTGLILQNTGDLEGAVAKFEKALKQYEQVGDKKHMRDAMNRLADVFLGRGETDLARSYISRVREIEQDYETAIGSGWSNWRFGQLNMAEQRWGDALEAFEQSYEAFEKMDRPLYAAMARFYGGLVYLVQGERDLAASRFEQVTAPIQQSTLPLSGLELAYVLYGLQVSVSSEGRFQSICKQWLQSMDRSFPSQWFLLPADIDHLNDAQLMEEPLVDAFSEDWVWEDPFGDCAIEVQSGARMYAANGRDLRYLNHSAPRMVRTVQGDWALETICRPLADDRPAIGGLLVWEDEDSYLRLDWGMLGPRSILFEGCLDERELLIGRGAPIWAHDTRHLRLERVGGHVRALCSPDGVCWFQVGQAVLDCHQVNVGLYAIGQIDRVLYPGSHRAGTAIGFDAVRLWQKTM
jgi:tetratricopeptide (TPR) repeat protein